MQNLSVIVSRINLGINSKKMHVEVPYSIFAISILSKFYQRGLIAGFSVENNRKIIINLRFIAGRSLIRNINLVSKPSNKVYLKGAQLLKKYKSQQLLLISNSCGLSLVEAPLLNNSCRGGKLLMSIQF